MQYKEFKTQSFSLKIQKKFNMITLKQRKMNKLINKLFRNPFLKSFKSESNYKKREARLLQ